MGFTNNAYQGWNEAQKNFLAKHWRIYYLMDKKRESEKLDEQKEPEEPMYSRVSRNLHTASLSISNEAF